MLKSRFLCIVSGTISEGLNGWSEAVTAGLTAWIARTAKTKAPRECRKFLIFDYLILYWRNLISGILTCRPT